MLFTPASLAFNMILLVLNYPSLITLFFFTYMPCPFRTLVISLHLCLSSIIHSHKHVTCYFHCFYCILHYVLYIFNSPQHIPRNLNYIFNIVYVSFILIFLKTSSLVTYSIYDILSIVYIGRSTSLLLRVCSSSVRKWSSILWHIRDLILHRS